MSFCNESYSFKSLDHTSLIGYGLTEQKDANNFKTIRGGLTSEHLDPVSSRNWKCVLSWIAFHPDEVSSFVDKEGKSILHHACLFRAPLDVIEAILFSAPELAKLGNDNEELPLHWAVRLSLPLPVLKRLLEAHPRSVFLKDRDGQMPWLLLWDRHKETLLDAYRMHGRERAISLPGWKLILLMVEAYVKKSDVSNFPLHSIIQCPFDQSFLCFAINLFRDEIRCKDENGNLPLHLACGSYLNKDSSADSLKILLDEYPMGAMITNGKGDFALHLAIASGKSWNDGVDKVLVANPSAIHYRDFQQHLYPFMLAAARDDASLSTVYKLLQVNPEYVH